MIEPPNRKEEKTNAGDFDRQQAAFDDLIGEQVERVEMEVRAIVAMYQRVNAGRDKRGATSES